MAQFINGVPQLSALGHEDLIYPGSVGDWERHPIVHNGGETISLFRIVVSGDFNFRVPFMMQRLNGNLSNRWTIEGVHDIEHDRQTYTFTASFTTGHSLLYSRMRMYKTAVELEQLLLARLLPEASIAFTVDVVADYGAFQQYIGQTHDSSEDITGKWLNENTMRRIYKWLTEVVPQFVNCWTPDSTLRAMQTFDPATQEMGTALDVLKSRNDNVLINIGPRAIVINKSELEQARENNPAAIRYACKEQTSFLNINPEQTLQHTPFMDLQAVGMMHQVLVRVNLLMQIHFNSSRVFHIFPSFDEFPGLLSEEIRAGRDMDSGLHCQKDPHLKIPPTVFRISGIVNSPGNSGVSTLGNSCFSDGNRFAIRKPSGCSQPYFHRVGDPTCCLFDVKVGKDRKTMDKTMDTAMAIYGNRTSNSNRLEGVVEDAYQWYIDRFGESDKVTLSLEFDDQLFGTFKAFNPRLKELKVHVCGLEGMSMEKAKTVMQYATSNDLVHYPKWDIYVDIPRETVIEIFEMSPTRPQNRTEISLSNPEFMPPIHDLDGIQRWFFSHEKRQVALAYFQGSWEATADLRNVFENGGYRCEEVISRNEHMFVKNISVRAVKEHVSILIDSVEFGAYYQTSLFFYSGPRYQI